MSELRRRVATAILLIPVVIGVVEWAPTSVLAALFAAIVVAGAWEWARIAGLQSSRGRTGYSAATALILGAAWQLSMTPFAVACCLGAGLVWWVLALVHVIRLERTGVTSPQRPSTPFSIVLLGICGWLVLVPAWMALVLLHRVSDVGPHLVLVLLVVVWGADIGAYFAGRRFGRHRLAPSVSPGKTWEGVVGGAVLALAAGAFMAWIFALPVGALACISLVAVLFSVLGDLVESAFKRRAGVKDSGGLLPGHGGILDRIDSLTAAGPAYFTSFIWILGAR